MISENILARRVDMIIIVTVLGKVNEDIKENYNIRCTDILLLNK